MKEFFIKSKSCPLCNNILIHKVVHCPNNIYIPCLECESCKIYLYTEQYYNLLEKLAIENKHKLNGRVYKYRFIKEQAKSNNTKTMQILKKISRKKSAKIKNETFDKKSKNKKIETRNRILARIKFGKTNKCIYYDKLYCSLKKSECDPSSNKCKFENKITSSENECVRSVVLSHNFRCINEEHDIIDVKAIFKIGTPDGSVISVSIPAAYCDKCNQYIVLKRDFKSAKQKGVLLCQVEDKTSEYLSKHKGSYYGMESKIHSLGYNVIKQYGYTYEQRKLILANIIENYNISIHEILSMLDLNISRKIGLANYADAVSKWKQDREFVANYKLGDIPDVIINKIVIGKRV